MNEDIQAATPDPFNPEALRLRQDFASLAGVKAILTRVPVRKPLKQEFIRVHPSEEFRLTTAVIELKEEAEIFLVAPHLHDELTMEWTPRTIFTAINRQGVVFLWPCKLPTENGRMNSWQESGVEAAEYSMTKWIRVQADLSLGAYKIFESLDELPEPEWPSDKSFQDLLRIGFRGRLIDDHDHPVLKRLRGEA